MKPEVPIIIRISPSRQRAWRVLEHVYGPGDYQPERAIISRLAPGAYQLEAGYPMRDPKHDASLLLAKHHGRGKEVRHVIISTREMPDATQAEYNQALNAVLVAAVEFARKAAPGCDFIAQPHTDRHHPHVHLTICASDGHKCVDWNAKDLSNFQGLSFLSTQTKQAHNLVPGRGRGKRPKGVGRVAYNHAVQGDCQPTREQQTAQQFSYQAVLAGIEAGTIAVTRRKKNGTPLSVLLDGKKIRLSTLRKKQNNGDNDNETDNAYQPEQRRSRGYNRG